MSVVMKRIPKRGGGTRLQKVRILKSGKWQFLKNPRKSKSRPGKSPARTKPKTRRKRTMARRRKKGRRSRKFTLPLAPVLGLAAGLAHPAQRMMAGDIAGAANSALYNYTGYSVERAKFEPDGMKNGLLPLVIGVLVHKFVGGPPLNLNRTLANANVPFIRI